MRLAQLPPRLAMLPRTLPLCGVRSRMVFILGARLPAPWSYLRAVRFVSCRLAGGVVTTLS